MSDLDDLYPHERPHHVYRIFDAQDRLLYVGCTEDVETRIYMHLATYTMVDAFLIHRNYDHHTSETFADLAAARHGERAAIKSERPLLNRQHNPTRWRRVSGQYVPADADTLRAHQELSAPRPNPEFAAEFNALFTSTAS